MYFPKVSPYIQIILNILIMHARIRAPTNQCLLFLPASVIDESSLFSHTGQMHIVQLRTK